MNALLAPCVVSRLSSPPPPPHALRLLAVVKGGTRTVCLLDLRNPVVLEKSDLTHLFTRQPAITQRSIEDKQLSRCARLMCLVHVWCVSNACLMHVWCMSNACLMCLVHVWCASGTPTAVCVVACRFQEAVQARMVCCLPKVILARHLVPDAEGAHVCNQRVRQ